MSSLHTSRNSSSSSLSSILSSIGNSFAIAVPVVPTVSNSETKTNTCVNVNVNVNVNTIEKILPTVIWLEYILPYLDRQTWNSLIVASKEIYTISKQKPAPWPTNNYCFTSSGSSQQAIESITMSYDGEYIACGSVIGTITMWNRHTGKLLLKKPPNSSLTGRSSSSSSWDDDNNDNDDDDNYNSQQQQRRSTPIGNVLKFSPIDYTLACGYENRICLWDISKIHKRAKEAAAAAANSSSASQQQKEHYLPAPTKVLPTWSNNLKRRQVKAAAAKAAAVISSQTLEIDFRRTQQNGVNGSGSGLYEITYIGFSTKNANRILARYGKMAYIWTKETTATANNNASSSSMMYHLTHQIPLTSSRCEMVSNPILTFIAVATNNSSSSSGNGNGNNGNNTNIVIDSRNNNDDDSESKGIIHVWDLTTNTKKTKSSTTTTTEGMQTTPRTSTSTKIIAYKKHVIRGLEFIDINNNNCNCLVSASLQGEIKFWIKKKKEEENRKNKHHGKEVVVNDTTRYICLYSFQSPGKIFSLTSWSSSISINNNNDDDSNNIYLAAGEARGQIRVWKVISLSTTSTTTTGLNKDINNSNSNLQINSGDYNRHLERQRHQNNQQQLQQQQQNNNIKLKECLVKQVGEHVHYDNIKLLSFVPTTSIIAASSLSNSNNNSNGTTGRPRPRLPPQSIAVSRAYDSRIYFQSIPWTT
ncbi:hypothetical protein FRACYDRAFT_235563 [Fragilariopsis cylindrus CCMP1102]|uniref:WD40 repeat-like protein n=1 Tax=Fragilariopsis cylindrus CCMP1102 TaxID=635003 RepID=A0A1E7FMY9_9STRA|nr:hypothetical protein FRACYDRAFT_235563 [Fragilariopsis cylindrus CCMP1102]|eukprot:OEU19506.1 hypothetical protein FRACYDRAFT_235563 [Fragilariopsis cylindrus CCMP1102]